MLAATGQVGLCDGLRLHRRLRRTRVDQNHIQRRVAEGAFHLQRTDQVHRQQPGMHGARGQQGPLQR
jgi:hypothetical protein